MSLAELERWPLERNWAAFRRAELAQHLTRYVVLPASRELCAKWSKSHGRPPEGASHPNRGRLDRGECSALSSSPLHPHRRRLRDDYRSPTAHRRSLPIKRASSRPNRKRIQPTDRPQFVFRRSPTRQESDRRSEKRVRGGFDAHPGEGCCAGQLQADPIVFPIDILYESPIDSL